MELAAGFEADPHQQVLAGKVIASLFFEPSTRTRLSFESAINHLGGRVIGFSDTSNTSVSKGETFHDTITVISNYCDMIVMRHYIEGAARYASEISKVPVVNAGDGANQPPSQTLLDLFSIKKTQGRLDNINIMMVGDLKYGRTVHSLLQALSHFNPTFTFVAPEELRMPDEYKLFLKEKGIAYTETERIEEGIKEADIVYMTRVQRELFRPDGVRTRQTRLHTQKQHARGNQREYAHPASAAAGGRNRRGCGLESESILFPADRKRRLHAHGNHQLPIGGNQVNHFCYV